MLDKLNQNLRVAFKTSWIVFFNKISGPVWLFWMSGIIIIIIIIIISLNLAQTFHLLVDILPVVPLSPTPRLQKGMNARERICNNSIIICEDNAHGMVCITVKYAYIMVYQTQYDQMMSIEKLISDLICQELRRKQRLPSRSLGWSGNNSKVVKCFHLLISFQLD